MFRQQSKRERRASTLETGVVTQETLNSINIDGSIEQNKENLQKLGGGIGLANLLGVEFEEGLKAAQVKSLRETFGNNVFPESPMKSYWSLLSEALMDTTLIILMLGASVSIIVGTIEEPDHGFIEGVSIFIAVLLVSNISSWNNYSKQLQFRALENTTADEELTNVFREGKKQQVNPRELVVGDIVVLQAGDQIPADSVMLDTHVVLSNESSLTGEPDDLKKTASKDCFLLSSCLVTAGEECRALVIGIGKNSRWGRIKSNLVGESGNTPLQDKLEIMTQQVGYIGIAAAIATFFAIVGNIFKGRAASEVPNSEISAGFISAFIYAITIIVVAIPEGLPLAVVIALAYSQGKMYDEQCLIRVLEACETMGNATNICSDKTGTLTENRMTVVEGLFGDVKYNQDNFSKAQMPKFVQDVISEQVCVNRSAYLVHVDEKGNKRDKPIIIGNKTEGALIMMVRNWGFDEEEMKKRILKPENEDKVYSFNSNKKRSTCILHRTDGTIRLYCKGASEWILKDCTTYLDASGVKTPLSSNKVKDIEDHFLKMADLALRTLVLAHKDYPSAESLPHDWIENPPDNSELCFDCVVGIIDPLREDVKLAVQIAQKAGITVRMVTGDNIRTASAIARQCGILTQDGIAVEGPDFRKMSPREVDKILPNLQVMARSSPDDKYLLVTRLNGAEIPLDREAWEFKHKDKGFTWDKHRDQILPGYKEEWEATRPEGGAVVGVTGDGTNDAPALYAADVGLAMGITGTKVAQGAADIVIRDDRFSSIVTAIKWGRSVFDSIRKFLQFQLTVNAVVLTLDFIAAAADAGTPLNAVQMLWVNLIMDTMGALALATEPPTDELLNRLPYKRNAPLISRPMARNIIGQALFQLALLFTLLFAGAKLFGVRDGASQPCKIYENLKGHHIGQDFWDVISGMKISQSNAQTDPNSLDCYAAQYYCPSMTADCLEDNIFDLNMYNSNSTAKFSFSNLDSFETTCLDCKIFDYKHYTIIFNAFVFCQIFNEISSRELFNNWNFFKGVTNNVCFIFVFVVSCLFQVLIVEFGGVWVKTEHLNPEQWIISVALAAITFIVGVFLRVFIPLDEDPASFAQNQSVGGEISVSSGYSTVDNGEINSLLEMKERKL